MCWEFAIDGLFVKLGSSYLTHVTKTLTRSKHVHIKCQNTLLTTCLSWDHDPFTSK